MSDLIRFPDATARQDRQTKAQLEVQKELYKEMYANLSALLITAREFSALCLAIDRKDAEPSD